MASALKPGVFTIAPGVSFLDTLASGLLARFGGKKAGPLALAAATVLLPNRRSARGLREAFLRVSDGKPLLLPTIGALGDVDDEALALSGAENLDLAPEIPALERQLVLARLVRARPGFDGGAVQAVELAGELARLLDQVQTEQLSLDALDDLVPGNYAAHWQETLDFLAILREHWPGIVAGRGGLDPRDRRNRLLGALAASWRDRPPQGLVIAAGSTGSIPAVAELLKIISRLPRGEVILPGFDRHMELAIWRALEPTHPQFGMKQLLERMRVDRNEVEPWLATKQPVDEPAPRAALAARALLPADATDAWRDSGGPDPGPGLEGVSLIEAPGPREEAGVIALLMREAAGKRGRTAALTTPDRGLARRVAAELRRWDLEIDDSAGLPLARTPVGGFLALTAEMAVERAAPVPLLAVLKHPLAANGMAPAEFRALARRFERRVLRGPRPGQGLDGLGAALGASGARPDLKRWFESLARAAAPFLALFERAEAPLAALVDAHLEFAETLAAAKQDGAAVAGAQRLWAGEAGEEAALFAVELRAAAGQLESCDGASYPAVLAALMAGRVVRPRFGKHPRLFIRGPLEARLLQPDLLIVGGLNEGCWPPEPPVDPWMSRPMREKLGLPSPDFRVGQSAHDFSQAFSAPRVVLTRSRKVEGSPTVPSRWLLRLKTLIGEEAVQTIDESARWLGWYAALNTPGRRKKVRPPAPRPPVKDRPRKLSVTAVEKWLRDPYAVYAQYILKLNPLEPLDADPGAADRGTFVHQALEQFVKAFPGELPADGHARLLEFGRRAFGPSLNRPLVWAFWWPRFERAAEWFLEQERARRETLAQPFAEVTASLGFEAPGGAFELTAKADRVDRLKGGGLSILDYKTGALPKRRVIEAGYAPQLPLEAALAARGGFSGIAGEEVRELAYWRLSGARPAGAVMKVEPALAAAAWDGLRALVAKFDDPEMPYLSQPHAHQDFTGYGDYDHLARVLEWQDHD